MGKSPPRRLREGRGRKPREAVGAATAVGGAEAHGTNRAWHALVACAALRHKVAGLADAVCDFGEIRGLGPIGVRRAQLACRGASLILVPLLQLAAQASVEVHYAATPSLEIFCEDVDVSTQVVAVPEHVLLAVVLDEVLGRLHILMRPVASWVYIAPFGAAPCWRLRKDMALSICTREG